MTRGTQTGEKKKIHLVGIMAYCLASL
uniref:Uncharacterized protein n=1 Tax=Anguilla anguilla TaxID=7936 RepID=A0A0E9SYH4_ANGAN